MKVFLPDSDASPNLEEWSFNPQSPIVINYVQGGVIPSTINIATTIKNYVGLMGDEYPEYFVKGLQNNPIVNNASFNLVALSGDIGDAVGDGYELTEANLEVTNTINFQNLSIAPIGTLITTLLFVVYGKPAFRRIRKLLR